jgi:hypothetical protein
MNKNIFNECLTNAQNPDLRSVQLKFQGCKDIPKLLTIYELIFPINIALQSINKNIEELKNDKLGEGAIQGLFVLGYSNFEVLLGDILNRYLSFFPEKLSKIKDNNKSRKENSEYQIHRDYLFSGKILNYFINKKLNNLFYDNIESILKSFNSILETCIELPDDCYNKLIEIKETRNLLLHNALIVNEKYISKTKEYKRSKKVNEILTIDNQYSLNSLIIIKDVINEIQNQILLKYKKYTLLNLLDSLWEYTFKPHIRMSDYFTINQDEDIYDGPIKVGNIDLCSSEELFMQIWIAQRFGKGISNFALCHIDSINVEKISLLTKVFGELRLTYW